MCAPNYKTTHTIELLKSKPHFSQKSQSSYLLKPIPFFSIIRNNPIFFQKNRLTFSFNFHPANPNLFQILQRSKMSVHTWGAHFIKTHRSNLFFTDDIATAKLSTAISALTYRYPPQKSHNPDPYRHKFQLIFPCRLVSVHQIQSALPGI